MLTAKATSTTDQSDSVVVSFDAVWQQKLSSRVVSVVIRKRIPKTLRPHWLYFHLNAPIGAIGGRAEIRDASDMSLAKAKVLAKELALSTAEITSYFQGAKTIGCYHLGTIQLLTRPLSLAIIRKQLIYFPPQSFMILSKEAKGVIDRMAGFRK